MSSGTTGRPNPQGCLQNELMHCRDGYLASRLGINLSRVALAGRGSVRLRPQNGFAKWIRLGRSYAAPTNPRLFFPKPHALFNRRPSRVLSKFAEPWENSDL